MLTHNGLHDARLVAGASLLEQKTRAHTQTEKMRTWQQLSDLREGVWRELRDARELDV
jgi:hypothetical protein